LRRENGAIFRVSLFLVSPVHVARLLSLKNLPRRKKIALIEKLHVSKSNYFYGSPLPPVFVGNIFLEIRADILRDFAGACKKERVNF
jgi:hypothetical protein